MLRGLIVCALIVSACGGDGPTQPSTPPTPTVNSVTITGLDAVRAGFFTNYTATANMSDGTTQTVTPAWTSSNPGIASVDSTGRLDAHNHGQINLAASYLGRSASKNVNVIHNYGGTWSGTYRMEQCDNSGVFTQIQWCRGLGGVGALLPFTLSLTQGGNSRAEITGTIGLGTLTGNIAGSVQSDARLVIGGTYTVATQGVTFSITIGGWNTSPAPGDSMSGGWAQNLSAIGATGNAFMQNRIVSVNHTSQQATLAFVPDRYSLTIDELFNRLRR